MPGLRKRTAVPVLGLGALLLSTGGCIERPDLSGPEVKVLLIARLLPELSPTLANTIESLRIVQMRVEVRDDLTREILSEGVVEVNPDVLEPDLVGEVRLNVNRGEEIELAGHLRLMGEAGRVEWSGLFGPAPVSTQRERWDVQVVMGRGDLPNLTVTGLAVSGPGRDLTVGESTTLAVTVVGGGQDSEVLWGSRDPEVVAVDRQGRVSALAPGEGMIVAAAGMQTTSVVVRVVP